MSQDDQKLSLPQKLAYGSGMLPGAFYQSFFGQIQIFYYAWMGLSIFYLTLGQIIYMIWNVINDPIFGVLEDRTRNKRGRYIPWIRWFSPLFTISFIILFVVPSQWRFHDAGASMQFWVFLWYLVSLLLYDTGFTVVYLAHAALLPQVSQNFKERTEMSLYAAILGGVGAVVSGLFPLIFLTNPTLDSIIAFQWCVVIFGAASMIPWMILWRVLKERVELIPETKESFWQNVKYVFKNPACRIYIIYDGLTVGINTILATAITIILSWSFGLENPYAPSTAVVDIMTIIPYAIPLLAGAIIGIYLQFFIPKKRDLKSLMLWDFMFMFIGFLLAFFGALPSPSQPDDVFIAPPNAWLMAIGLGIAMLGFFGNLIYLNPLNADVVDYDEFLTGARRESVYSGINCIFSKPMASIALIIFPAVLSALGLQPAAPGDPTSNALVVVSGFKNAITGVAMASFLVPALLAIIGYFCFLPYPLDKKKLADIRPFLDNHHAEQRQNLDAAKSRAEEDKAK
jgi:glycoside/pentoside/hexuronide:cation symporter, GPH family